MINLQNIQIAHAAQYQKNKQPNQEMSRRSFFDPPPRVMKIKTKNKQMGPN